MVRNPLDGSKMSKGYVCEVFEAAVKDEKKRYTYNQRWFWRFKSLDNNEIICVGSEPYASAAKAKRGFQNVVKRLESGLFKIVTLKPDYVKE